GEGAGGSADSVRTAVLPRETRPAEDEEDLLGRPVDVGRRRPQPRLEADPLEAHADRSGRTAEVAPCAADVAGVTPLRLDIVPVRDPHASDYRARAAAVSTAARTTTSRIGAR